MQFLLIYFLYSRLYYCERYGFNAYVLGIGLSMCSDPIMQLIIFSIDGEQYRVLNDSDSKEFIHVSNIIFFGIRFIDEYFRNTYVVLSYMLQGKLSRISRVSYMKKVFVLTIFNVNQNLICIQVIFIVKIFHFQS